MRKSFSTLLWFPVHLLKLVLVVYTYVCLCSFSHTFFQCHFSFNTSLTMFRITSYGLDFHTTEFPIVKYQWFFEWTRGALFTVVKLLRNVWAYSLLLARIMTREWRTINRCAAKFRENVFIWKPFTSINVYRTRNIVCFSSTPVDGLYSVLCAWCMQWVYVKERYFNAIKSRKKSLEFYRKKIVQHRRKT